MIVLTACALLCGDIHSQSVHEYTFTLTDRERDKIWRSIHLAVKKMNFYMDQAEREASHISNIDIRDSTVGAIEGAIAGLAGGSPYTVVISGCLGALARIGGRAYVSFCNAQENVKEAKIYANIADNLEEQLWRDE